MCLRLLSTRILKLSIASTCACFYVILGPIVLINGTLTTHEHIPILHNEKKLDRTQGHAYIYIMCMCVLLFRLVEMPKHLPLTRLTATVLLCIFARNTGLNIPLAIKLTRVRTWRRVAKHSSGQDDTKSQKN